MDVVRVVQRLRLAPDDGEGGCDVGRPRRVRELHLVAVDGVAQQLRIHTRHPALDVELAHKSGLDDELGDVVNFDPDGFLQTRRHEDLRGAPRSCIHPRAERGSGTNARPDPVDPGDQDVVPAVLGGVVGAPVPVDAPVAGEEGGHAGGAGAVGVAVEEGEVGRNEVGTLLHSHREFAREVRLSARDDWEQVVPENKDDILEVIITERTFPGSKEVDRFWILRSKQY